MKLFLFKPIFMGVCMFCQLVSIPLLADIVVDHRKSQSYSQWFDSHYELCQEMQKIAQHDQENFQQLELSYWKRSEHYEVEEAKGFDMVFAPEQSLEKAEWEVFESFSDNQFYPFEDIPDSIVFYLHRSIKAKEAVELPLTVSCNMPFKIWLNKRLVITNKEQNAPAQSKRIELKKGENQLLIKIDNHYDTSIRFSLQPPIDSMDLLAHFLSKSYKEIKDNQLKEMIAWEIEDNIWSIKNLSELHEGLCQNYIDAMASDFELKKTAENFIKKQNSFYGLKILRLLYQIDHFCKKMDYVQVNYPDDHQGWQAFKTSMNNLIKQSSKAIDDFLAGNSTENLLQEQLEKTIVTGLQIPVRLPSTPLTPGRFGGYYTDLKYYPEWDNWWRIGDHPDLVIVFPEDTHKFVFWRGTNYIPHWVTEKGFWYNNEFNETWFSHGSAEPMSDKDCRYSHVRLLASHPGRVVVHWRYALNDVKYDIAWPDKFTGWGDWSDEYYYIYPDAVGVRKVILHTSYASESSIKSTDESGHEWQEGIVVYHPFTTPEDYLHIDAVHVANMQGKSGKWSWKTHGEPTTPTPDGSNIVMMNMKSNYKPFVISQEGVELSPYEGAQGGSHFRWRDHWPTTREPTPGRNANGLQAAHGSFFHVLNIPYYEKEKHKLTKIMLHGLTQTAVEGLVPVAQSWLKAPELKLVDDKLATYEGYDMTQRAYVLTLSKSGTSATIDLDIMADKESPMVNPVLIFNNLETNERKLSMNGQLLKLGSDYSCGTELEFKHTKQIYWINKTLTSKTRLSFQ